MYQLGLAPLTIMQAGPLEFVVAAASAGFDFVTLRLVAPNPGDPVHPLVGHPEAIREIRTRLADGNLTVFDIESVWLTPERDVAALEPAFALAAELGASHVLTTGNDKDQGRLAANFAATCDLAARYGLTVALEFMPFVSLSNLARATALIEAAGRPNARLLIDALHLDRSGGTPDEVAALPTDGIAYVQICDARADRPVDLAALRLEARTDRLYPGEGALPLARLMHAVAPEMMVAVEAPCAAYAHLPAAEQAGLCAAAARRFLSSIRAGSARR